MPRPAPPPDTDRKQLARLVALAEWNVDRTSRLDPRREDCERRFAEAQARLSAYDDAHPAEALSALDADGPGSNLPLYHQRRAELVVRVEARRRRIRQQLARP